MGKRFGRNQKRRLTQELTQCQHSNSALVQISSTQVFEIGHLQSRLRAAERVLGMNNPAFPPGNMEARRAADFDRHATVRVPNGVHVHPMTMVLDENAVLFHREQAHVILTYGPHRWGYAITEKALHCYPREVLARVMADAFTDMVLDQLNKLETRK